MAGPKKEEKVEWEHPPRLVTILLKKAVIAVSVGKLDEHLVEKVPKPKVEGADTPNQEGIKKRSQGRYVSRRDKGKRVRC